MENHKEGPGRQEGFAMIIVMCVMAVAVGLSLALLLTASVLIDNAVRAKDKEQCRINAVAVSDLLIGKIKSFRYDTSSGASVMPDKDAPMWDSSLKEKLKTVATTGWYAYDPDAGTLEQLEKKGKDYYTYNLQDCGLPGKTAVELYWVDESGEDWKELDGDPDRAQKQFSNVLLYVKVTSTVREEASTIISTFKPVVNLGEPEGEGTDPEQPKVWKEWYWQYLGHEWERGTS